MSYTPISLASGQLPLATTALFTASAPTIIKTITLVNTDVSERLVNLYIKKGTSLRAIIPPDLPLGAGYRADTADETYTLSVGDSIQGDCDAASVIDYTISGTY